MKEFLFWRLGLVCLALPASGNPFFDPKFLEMVETNHIRKWFLLEKARFAPRATLELQPSIPLELQKGLSFLWEKKEKLFFFF